MSGRTILFVGGPKDGMYADPETTGRFSHIYETDADGNQHEYQRHGPFFVYVPRNLDDEPQNLPKADEPVASVEADREAEKAGETEAAREEGSQA